MSKMRILDVIEPSVFQQYVIERIPEKNALFQSGIIGAVPEVAEKIAGGGGRTVNMPFWQDLTGEEEILSDGVALTPDKIGSSQDVATVLMRGKAWAANDLAKWVAGSDPMGAIADGVAAFWAKRDQVVLTSILQGIFDPSTGTLKDTHVNDVAIEDGDNAAASNLFSDDNFLDTAFLLGDRSDEFTGMVVHSVVQKNLLKLGTAKEEIDPADQKATIVTYRGRRVFTDDRVPIVAGATTGYKYWSILFGPGAVGYAERNIGEESTETDRDTLAGDDILVNRRHYVLHPRGVKWTGSPSGASATNTELATPGNWSRVYDADNIRMAALITNG